MLIRTLRELAAPNIRLFTAYRSENLRPDLVAGLSVAAVQIPTAIAYAQLAGFPPIVGLYASILPSIVYALFGSSRQLMMGPDAATCAMVAATLVPLAGANPARYLQLSMALAVLVGVVCILAGLGGAGFIATFLSRPILNGFLNGTGLTIIAGQLGKIFGFRMEASDFFPRLAETVAKLGQIHRPTSHFFVRSPRRVLRFEAHRTPCACPSRRYCPWHRRGSRVQSRYPRRRTGWPHAWRQSAIRPAQ